MGESAHLPGRVPVEQEVRAAAARGSISPACRDRGQGCSNPRAWDPRHERRRAFGDPEPLVREHAAWALERTRSRQ